MRKRSIVGAGGCLLLLSVLFVARYALVPASSAAEWPSRAVRLVTPAAPGGGSDAVARILAEALAARWRQPVVVDNRPGADGSIAVRALLDARDGHTLLFAQSSVVTVNPYLTDRQPFDPARDLAPIAQIVDDYIAVAATGGLNVTSMDDLIERARAAPRSLSFAAPPGVIDLVMTAMFERAGVRLTFVPYRNPLDAIPDLIQGRLHALALPLGSLLGQARAGNARLLAVMNAARSSAAPEVPTFGEIGYGDFTFAGLMGVLSQPAMAAELRERVASDIAAILADPLIAQRVANLGYTARPLPTTAFAETLEAQHVRWSALARARRNALRR